MNESQNTPELRFEGFTEPWEQRKVSDIATLRRGLTYSPSDVVSPGQGVRVLRSSNVDEDRFVLRNDDVFVKEEAVNIPFSRDGEVLITAANGSTRLVGKRAKISGLMGKTVHGGFMLIAATEQPDFLCALMGTEWYRNFLHIGVAGGNGAIGNLDSHALECEKIRIPSSDEQHLVGGFFRDLDSLIDLQQRKYERLQHLKQALLRKMFPKPGEQVPELRFEGFTEPWKRQKLGDIAEVTMGQSPNGSCYTDNPEDPILVQGNADLRDGWVFPRVWTTQVTKTARAGDLIMSVRAPVGAIGKTAYDVVLGRGVCGIKGNEFLFQFLSKLELEKYWFSVSTGSTFDSINGDELRATPIFMPTSIQEQEAIGSLLSRLDSFITLYQRKYERLQHLKQALLQRMFV